MNKFIAEINPHEMALRIGQAACGIKKPEGLSAEEALDEMRKIDAETVAGFYRAAWAAAQYLEESINDYKMVN